MGSTRRRSAPHTGRGLIKDVPRGEPVTVRVERLAYGGAGVGRVDGKVCFVRGALPGETVIAERIRCRARFDEAETVRVRVPHADRVAPECPSFGPCGGCDLLHLAPDAQPEIRCGWVRDALRCLPDAAARVEPTEPSPEAFGYRNRMSYSVAAAPTGLVLGFHARSDPARVLDASRCRLHSDGTGQLLGRVRSALAGLPPAEATRVSRVEIRESHRTGHRLLHLLARRPGRAVEAVATAVEGACDTAVASYGSDPRVRPVSRRILFGSGFIEEDLGGWRFQLGPGEFFQVNTPVAERLFAWIRAEAEALGASRILELYAGAGVLAAVLAGSGRAVLGFEADAASVTAAGRNLRRNGIAGARIRRRRVEDLDPDRLRDGADLLVADPPRAGLSPRAREIVLAIGAPNLILVSCDPATLARDLGFLTAGGYDVERVKPFDMFPQTARVEVAVRLRRERSRRRQ